MTARFPKPLQRRDADARLNPRCKCSHPHATHGTDRNGRPICFGASCGCASYRPVMPAGHDERYAPDERRHADMGAGQPSEWPEPYEVAE